MRKHKMNGDMIDYISKKSRQYFTWRSGVGKKIKRASNKILRQDGKKETKL